VGLGDTVRMQDFEVLVPMRERAVYPRWTVRVL
jgi:hypothetical protein